MASLPSPFGIPTGDELINVGSLATKLLEPQLIKGLHLAKETFFGEKPAAAEPPADDVNAQLKAAYDQQQSAGDDLKTAYAKQQEESGAQNDTLKRVFQLNQDIRSKTAQQLYDDPAFDPFEAFQTLEKDLTPEDVDKLVETRKLQTAPGLHLKRRARALAQVPEAVSQFIKGGPQLLSRFADLGSPDKAIRTKAAAEIVTGMEQANLEVSDLLRTGLRKAKDDILDPGSITSMVRGSGLGIKGQDITDHKQRFFTDLAHRRQIEGALEGRGFWTTLAGLDAKTLSEKGIEVDPDAIQNLSEWLDLTNFIPFGAGFKVAKQGARTTLRATDAAVAESFLTRARQKTAETLQKAGAGIEKRGIWTGAGFGRGGAGGAVIDIALGGTGLVGAGAGMLGGMVSPAAIRAAGRTVKFAGTQLAKPGPMLRLAETAAGAAARGAVAGTVASVPFAAAAETPEEQTLIAGVGAGLGTAGGVAALPVVQAQKGIAGIVNKSFEGAADLKPVARHTKPDSIDAGLESTHQGLMDRLEQLDPNYYNLVQRMRALVGAVGGELFFTAPATFKQRAGRTAEGAILEGDIEQVNPDGTTKKVPYMLVEFNGQRTPESLFHEPGHLLFKIMPEASRNAITAAIQDTFTPEQLQEINAGYAEWLGTPGNVIDEISAELISGVLRGSDLTGFEQSKFPKVQKMVQSAYEAAANALDQLGLYDITQSAAPGAVGQQLGFGLSPRVGDIVRGYLRNPEQAEAIKAAIAELERTATPPTLVQPVQGTSKPVVEPARRMPTAIPATTADREQAATDAAQIATSASPIVPPGGTRSARELLGDIAAAIAQQAGVKINYLSALAEPAASISSNRVVRREMVELFRSMPQSARALWEKTFFPERLIQTGTGIQVLGWAPEVFAANAHKIAKSVGDKSALLPYPVDPKTGTFTDAGWQALFQDTQAFVRNQLSGRTGAGEGLVVPTDLQNRGFYKPPVTGTAAPLDQRKADFINLLFGIPLPKTPRITTGKLPLNIAGQDISVETKPGRVSVPVEPRAKFGEGSEKARAAAEQLGITGREILEINPLRAELEAAGVKLPGLIEAVQRLDANNIKEVQLAPEQPQFRGNTLTLSAGFQPKPAEPRAVKEAAVRDPQGNIFTGRWHGEAAEKALAAGSKPYKNGYGFDDGFVTNAGEFLSRREAVVRAEELQQISKAMAKRTDALESIEFAESQGRKDIVREIRKQVEEQSEGQFQPTRDERSMMVAPGQRLIEVLGPDGTVYKARFDGYQEVPGRAPVAQITPVDGFPWQGDSKRSTTYETTIVKRGFKVPELPTPEQWESERVETGFTQFQPKRAEFENPETLKSALQKPGWAIITATQEKLGPGTNETNRSANEALAKELEAAGFETIPVGGSYKGEDQGLNYLVLGIAPEQASAIGQKHKQESVLVPAGLLYADGTVTPAKIDETLVGDSAAKQDFYSKLPDGTAFSIPLDFSAERKPSIQPGDAPEKEVETILTSAQFMPAKKKKEPLPLQLVHYSDSGPELTDIDPAFMRQVHPRFGQDTQKSFWFVKGSESGKAQLNFKNRFVYEAGVKNKKIYDATGNDPLGFFDKYADNWQAMDQNIIDAGYDGVRVQTNDGRQVVILYEKIPAKHIGQTDEFGNFHAVESGQRVTFKKKPGIGAVAVRWKGKIYPLLKLLEHGSYPAKALENLGVLSLADFEESGFPIESGFINEDGEFVPEEQAFQQVGAQFQPRPKNITIGEVSEDGEVRSETIPYSEAPGAQHEIAGMTKDERFRLVGTKLYWWGNPDVVQIESVKAHLERKGFDVSGQDIFMSDMDFTSKGFAKAYERMHGEFQPRRTEQEQPNFRHNESVFKDESGFWIDSNGKLFPTPNHEQTARELLGMKPYSIEDEPTRLEASNQLSKKGWAQVVYDDELGIVFIRGPRVTNAQKSELVRLAIEKELRLRQDLPSGRLVDLYTPPDQLQGELSPGERAETIYGFLKKSAFQPKRAEQEQLFGGREFLSSVELGNMTKAEIADHFPEAVIPAKRDEKIPSEITKSPLYKRAADDASAVTAFADKLVEFANQYKDDPLFKSGSRWYSEFTPMLKREFGADAQLMAELLAATSPQTPPGTNFGYAFDALEGFRSGRFKKTIDKFNQGLDMLAADRWLSWYNKELKAGNIPAPPAEPTPAAFLEHWIATYDLKPRQSNGKLYGTHSLPVLQVFVRRWLELNKGLKTRNFVENLTGESHEATIDLWADRTMRRLGYEGTRDRWRILPQNGTGVSDEDFSFAQRAFRAAADKLGMKPDALQGALWFAEKSLWADNGWGRIDLGDFRKEMEKLPLLRAGVRHRLAQTATSQKGKSAAASELLVEPRKLK